MGIGQFSYNYTIINGLLVVFSTDNEEIVYLNRYSEYDEAEDALVELTEEGVIPIDSILKKVSINKASFPSLFKNLCSFMTTQ